MDRQVERPIPAKIEQRLMELLKMEEFDMHEVNWCRDTYWTRRSDWHVILVACHDTALARGSSASADQCAQGTAL